MVTNDRKPTNPLPNERLVSKYVIAQNSDNVCEVDMSWQKALRLSSR